MMCHMCSHSYADWRDRCPACGTAPKRGSHAGRINQPRMTQTHQGAKPTCVACLGVIRKAKQGTKCPTCKVVVHRGCLKAHTKWMHMLDSVDRGEIATGVQ